MAVVRVVEPEPFADRVDLLLVDLEFAILWDRPAILLAVYASEFVRARAQDALAAEMRQQGQKVIEYRVTDEGNADIPLGLRQHPDRENAVFFVSGLQWGKGRDQTLAYRALNIRREYLVEDRIRAVFWLTEQEATALPRLAPDFWAFRHRVVEFVEAPAPDQIVSIAHDLAWRDLSDRTVFEDTDAKIALREALLADLPDTPETLEARTELLFLLGALYQAKNDSVMALSLWSQMNELVERHSIDSQLTPWVWLMLGSAYFAQGRMDEAITAYCRTIDVSNSKRENRHARASAYGGLGNVYAVLQRYDEAIAACRTAIALDPQNTASHNSLGNVYRSLGRYDEAIVAYQQAITLDPHITDPYIGLGIIYFQQGRYSEAAATCEQVIDINPKLTSAHIMLAVCYRLLGDEIAYRRQVIRTRPLMVNEDDYSRALFAVFLGETDEAVTLLQRSLTAVPENRSRAQHDPVFNFIRDDPRFQALMGQAVGEA